MDNANITSYHAGVKEGGATSAPTEDKLEVPPRCSSEGCPFRRCFCCGCQCACCCEGHRGEADTAEIEHLADSSALGRLSTCEGNVDASIGRDDGTAPGEPSSPGSLEIPNEWFDGFGENARKLGDATSLEDASVFQSLHKRLQRRICICMVSDFFFPSLGGVEMHIYELSLRLARRGLFSSSRYRTLYGNYPHAWPN